MSQLDIPVPSEVVEIARRHLMATEDGRLLEVVVAAFINDLAALYVVPEPLKVGDDIDVGSLDDGSRRTIVAINDRQVCYVLGDSMFVVNRTACTRVRQS